MTTYTSITPSLYAIGNALLGYTVTGDVIGITAQHSILANATLAELVAAKTIIQQYHSNDIFALLMVDCYLTAKSRKTVQRLAS